MSSLTTFLNGIFQGQEGEHERGCITCEFGSEWTSSWLPKGQSCHSHLGSLGLVKPPYVPEGNHLLHDLLGSAFGKSQRVFLSTNFIILGPLRSSISLPTSSGRSQRVVQGLLWNFFSPDPLHHPFCIPLICLCVKSSLERQNSRNFLSKHALLPGWITFLFLVCGPENNSFNLMVSLFKPIV